jgi:hypothetical protein
MMIKITNTKSGVSGTVTLPTNEIEIIDVITDYSAHINVAGSKRHSIHLEVG